MEEKEILNSSDDEVNKKVESVIDQYQSGMDENEKEQPFILPEDENGIKIHYSINSEEYSKGFKVFQKKYTYPKNVLLTVLFAIIMGLFIEQLFHEGANQGAIYTILAVCVGVVFITWYNTFKAHKNLMAALSQIEDDNYTTIFTDSKIIVSTDLKQEEKEEDRIPPKIIEYDFDMPDAVEIKDMFLIYLKKRMIYIIPKKYLSSEEICNISMILSENLGKRMIVNIK